MKELSQTDRDYIYDNLIDVQEVVNKLVEELWEEEIDEEELRRKNEVIVFWFWAFLWALISAWALVTLEVIWIL